MAVEINVYLVTASSIKRWPKNMANTGLTKAKLFAIKTEVVFSSQTKIVNPARID